MDRQEELLKFLQSKGLYEGVDLQRFKRGLMDEAKAQTLFEAMKSDGSLDADIDYDYWRDYHNIPAAQKKSQSEIQAGLGAASKPISPLSSGVDFTAPIQDVARQVTQIQAERQPVQPQQPVEPPRVEQRVFGGRQIPSPVAPGKEDEALTMESIASRQRIEALQRGGAIVGEAIPRQAIGQVESDFPVKSANTAIKELEDARKQRQEGQRPKTKAEEFVTGRGEAVVPVPEKLQNFFKDTRLGKVLSQGGAAFGATAAGTGAGVLNIPELVSNTIENIALDAVSAPLRKQLKEGKITQEQFNAYTSAAREATKKAQMVAPITPRKIEYLADTFLNADQLEDNARKNLKTVQERIDNSDKGFEGLIKERRVGDAFQYAATQAIGSLPYALAAALPGGVYTVGAVAAQDKYRTIEDEVGAENMRSAETLNALGTGITEGLSEAVTAGIVKRAGALVKGLGKAGAQKTIAQQIKSLFKATIGSSAEEAVSELAAQLAENIIDKATIKPDKDVTEGLMDAVAIGAISGGGITGIAGTIGLAAGRRQAQAQAPGAPTAQAGAAPAPTPPVPGAPTQPPGAPAAAPTAPTRPFGPLGESAPDANVYADEILGNYRPEGGQMTAEEADRMVQDFLDTMLEVDEDEGDVKPPKPGTWEAEVYADVDARRQEIAQAVMALAATPKPTQGAPTEQAAQTPIDRLAREIYDIYGGQELTQEQANNIVDEHLASLTSKNELGETVYSAGYDEVLMAGDQIANKIVELSKQPADATQKVEQVQPQGGERQYTGAQEVQDQAATEAGIGDRAVSGGVQPEAQVTEQERSTKVSEIESRRQDIISRKTTPQEKFEFLESIPEGTIFKNDDDGSAVIVSKKTTSRGAETYELTPIVFNEDTMQWEDNPSGVKIVERKANGEFNLNAELPAIFTSQSSIVFPTDALYQRTLEALKPSVAQPTAPPQEAVAPTEPTATQPEVTTPVTNLESAPTQPVQAPEGGLPEGFQQISAEEEAKQEQEEIKLRRGMAAERRKAGRYTKGSVEYVRNPIDDTSPRGNTEAIYFTDMLQQQITYKVIEADNLQPSHLGNKVNSMHFIPEAQPKDRTKGSDSVDAQQRIAFRADPNLLGQNTNAYSGAPIVNKRNEVIQGNNRSAGIKLGYGSNSFGRYRQWLIDNADQFGLDPLQIAAMKNPVLVREANVPDDRAIELGQYVAQDMESGSVRPIDSVALSTKMSDQEKAQIASIIYEDDLADVATMNEVVRAKWKKIVPIISKHLSGGEKTFLMGRGNNISAEGVTSIIELFEQFLFDGADIDVKRIFKSTMPDKAMKAIRKSLRFIFSVPVEASLIEDMQDAFLAYGAYKKQVEASGTKNFDLWLNNPTVFEAAPSEVFSPLAIELARRFHTMQREVDLIDVFKQYAALTRVEEGGMFPSEGEAMTKADAVKQIFNVEYETRTEEEAGATGTTGDVGGQGATQLGAQQPTGAEMVEGADVEGETTVAEPTPQPIAPPAPVNQTGTLRNPHTKKLYPNRPAGKFLDVSLVSEAELAGFLKAKTPEAKQKLKAQFKTAKRLQKIADMLGVKVYYGDGTTFGKGEAGTTSTSRSDSDPVQRAIYINFEVANENTLSHELAHAFLSRSWAKNSETMSNEQIIAKVEQIEKEGIKLKNRLVAILKDSGDADLQKLSNDIEAWAKMYPAHLRGEEYVVELAARLSEGMRDKIVDNSTLAKIERAINAFFDALLGKDQIQVRLTDTKDLIDFINTLSKGVVDGDAKSIDAALELYESGRVTSPRKTIYWKKQEIKDGKAFVRELINKINAQDNFDTVKDIESIVNKILAQVFSPGRYIVKFNSAADAAGFVENLNIGAKADNKNSIKISKDVAADMAVAINDHLSTILDRKQQIATDLTPEENADMERFTEMFPPVRGITPEPTADETRVIEKLQAEQVKSEETFGKMINAVTVAPVANQDAIAGKPDNTKMRMVQDRTGVIPNGLAGQLTVSGSPHGMHGMFSTILSKMRSIQRQGVTKADAAKAIFAQAFDGKAVHAYTFFDKVRIIDPALITTEREGGKEYYMFNGSGAASILLNSELGQTFLQDLSEGRRNAEFEAQATEIISLYGIDPTTFFNRVYAAQTAFGDGNIAAAEKALNNGRSLIAAITGVGTLTKQEARALENAIINDGALPVKTTGNDRLDSRADAMALALNIDKGVARNILYHLVGKHLTSPLDHNAVDDAIDLSDMEFYPQLSMLTDSDYDNGFERLSFQRVGTGNMHNYTSLPFYNQARDFVARELDKGTFDKDIVAALSRMYPTHLTGFDAKDFFEGIAARPYRSRVGMDDVSAAVFKLIRHAYRMQWGNAKMELSNIRSFLRDRAYSYDYSIGNDLAPVRQIQRDVEKYLGYLLPKESAAYQKMQLYTSAAAFKIDQFTNRFYGDRKALREGKFTDSFISRLAKSTVGSVNEFNTFLVNMHRWERIDRAIDIQERFLSNMYNELASIAQGLGITVQPLGTTFDAATARREIASMLAAMNAGNIKSPATKLKINRFTEELASLDQALGLRDGMDGIVDRFQQYVRSKGINPAGLKPRDLENMPEFADHFTFLREFKGMQIEYLDILRDAGHLNDERYNHLKNGTSGESDVVWDYYTPLVYDEFAFRDEMGFPPTLAESKVATFKIFGISLLRKKRGNVSPVLKKGPITVGMLDLSNLESPVEVFFHRMASAIKFKERNDAINSLANMLEQTGSNKYANFAARYSIQKDRWGTITSANDLIPDRVKNQSVTYYKDGKRRYLYFADPNDPMLAKLNKGFDDFTMWEQFWRHTNNFARAAFTYMNPGFIEASLFRDVMEAGVNIMVESRGLQINNFKTRLGKNFVKYYSKSSKFFLAPMFAKDPEIAKYYQEIQEFGGFMSWSFDSMELLEDAEAKVKDNIAYAEQYAQGRTKLENLRMLFTNSLDALTAISNRVEMMPRLATYASLREMGIDPIRAAEAAKNITVNFEKKGASNTIKRLSVYYLFLNPSIQGVRKFGKQLYSPEGRKYLLAYAAATAAARGLLYMMPYLAGDDEEERKRIAEKIDRYIYDKWASDTKVLLPNPLDPENPFTAPKPYNGFRLASAIGEGIVDMYVGKKTSADVTENIIRQIKGAFDPIAGTSSYSNQYMDALPLPLLHPFFEAVANVDYQGRPILFDQSGAFDYLKANKGTAQVYHTIAQNVYRYTPGHIDISPTSYEHVTESYFKLGPSRIINNLVKAGNNLTDPESGKTDAERQKHFLKEVISANRVLYNPNISEDDKRDLYNYLSMSSAKMGSWNEEKVKYAERAIVLTKQKMLVNPKVIQDSLDDLLSQIVFSGKLYQKVPGQEITWAQWYSAMSAIGDKRTGVQHKRYINDKIRKALEESGNEPQE